eukprot:1413711-Pleurochrysis_carterae.AAC.2
MMSSSATRCRIGSQRCCQRATRASYAASLKCDAHIRIILLQNTDDAFAHRVQTLATNGIHE